MPLAAVHESGVARTPPLGISALMIAFEATADQICSDRVLRFVTHLRHKGDSENGIYGMSAEGAGHSALMPANLTTLAHFPVSSAMSLPKSAGEPGSTVPPRSASRALILKRTQRLRSFSFD
jgi:hypothetical protein